MKKILSLAVAATATLFASAAFPCGAPFGAGVNVDPSQDIVLVHKADTETYVFQPTFCGDAKDFGMILPVPAMLTAEPTLAAAKTFDEVEEMSKPIVEKRTECRTRGGVGSTFGPDAGATPGSNDSTTIVSSGSVGFLDWVQLDAKDEGSLTAWLDANGYPYDAAAKEAFTHYVTKKWLFVAFKVSNGAPPPSGKNCKSLGPIKLSFKTPSPVVPSRIATAGATADRPGMGAYGFSWRIFSITDGGKQLAFQESLGPTRKLDFSGKLDAAAAAKLDGLAGAGDRLTKLTMWFDKSQTEDVRLALATGVDHRTVVYDTTYVDCDEGGKPIDPGTPAPAPNAAATGGSSGGGGCSTTGHGSAGTMTFALLGLAALAVTRRRRG